MKNSIMLEEMLAIANKYALVEETTIDARETKRDKKLSHTDQPRMLKPNDKKRKHDHYVANVVLPHHNRTDYRPWLGKYEGFLDGIYIFHPKSTRLGSATSCNVSQMKSSNQSKRLSNFPEARKEVNYIYNGLNSYESKRKKKLTTREVMVVRGTHHLRPN
jgi:hypothetical protein